MILKDYSNFLDSWFSEIEKSGIDISGLPLDHLGYSVASSKEYDTTKKKLMSLGKLIREVIISDRRVSVFQLTNPLNYKDYFTSAIELIEPKKGEKPHSGFEHAEFTLNFSFEEFVEKYPNLAWDVSNINRPDFPRLKLVFDNGMELKFNNTPILKS